MEQSLPYKSAKFNENLMRLPWNSYFQSCIISLIKLYLQKISTMTEFNLFSLNSFESDMKNSLIASVFEFGTPNESLDFWAETSLKRSAEQALAKVVDNNNFGITNNNTDPPNTSNGFKFTFGLQLLIGYKARFKATANLGYGYRKDYFGGTASLHFAAYNTGLGTGIHKDNLALDITTAVNLTVGGGKGIPLQSYTLNYNSPIPMLNDFKNSFSYGQLATWNSNVNKNKFSFQIFKGKE